MLRTLKHGYLMPELIGFRSDNDGAAVTASFGALLGTYSRPAVGINRLALTKSFHRAPLCVSTPGAGVTAGSYAVNQAIPAIAQLNPQVLKDADGLGEDGLIHSLCLGWMSDSTDPAALKQAVKCPLYSGRLYTGQFDASAAKFVLGQGGFKSVSAGVTDGDFTFYFRKGFGVTPVVVATLVGANGGIEIAEINREYVRIKTFNVGGTATNIDFNIFIYSTVLLDEHTLTRLSLKTDCRKADLHGFRITVTGGTPTLSIGGDYATVADTGTGVFTVTLTKASAKQLIVLANASNRCYVDSVDTDSFVVNCTDNAGTGEDPTQVDIFALSTEDSNEYYQE